MLIHCICILAGAYATEVLPELPGNIVLVVLACAALLLFAIRQLRPIACVLTGFGLMSFSAMGHIQEKLDPVFHGKNVTFTGRIADFVQPDPVTVNFVAIPTDRSDLPQRIRLNWLAEGKTPQVGETWRLQTRLRRPRGYANPGGFDYEGWLFRQKTGATGYVVTGPGSYQVHGETVSVLSRIRRNVVLRIEQLLPADTARAVMIAIGVGARHEISRGQWDLYARTGTSHLMAISGLHIGLASASTFAAAWAILGFVVRRRNVLALATIASVMAAVAYAALSGLAIPARRASLMIACAGAMMLMRHRIGPAVLIAVPCLVITVTAPIAILSPGFKLSFAAVAILLFIAGRYFRPAQGISLPMMDRACLWARQIGHVQCALLAGLFPLTSLIFDRFALVAPAVNIFVLPIFNFLTVPLTLAGIVLGGQLAVFGDPLLTAAHESTRWVLSIVATAGRPGAASFELTGNLVALSLVPMVYVLLPGGWPGRKIAFLAIAAVVLYRPPSPPGKCFQYHVLDVGQGLATVVQTRHSTLLFDTGPAYQSGNTAADLVVLPFLAYKGIRRVDQLVVSHGDLDHAGGIRSILSGIETGQILTGEYIDFLGRAQHPCIDGEGWRRDGVRFQFIHPRAGSPWKGNNSSCVLEVSTGGKRLLLTGDIEAPVEILLGYREKFSESEVVVVPHHGSRTSSRATLVDPTRPSLAIVAAGYGNRWGFPKRDVVNRWEAAGAAVVNTATSGAVSQQICAGRDSGPVFRERIRAPRYWRDVDDDAV
jgi:competence protein ComEC